MSELQMTNHVTRYTQPVVQTTPGLDFKVEEVELFEDPKGKWVRWEDYASLQNAYDQMARHHAKAHGVPVVEPPAEPDVLQTFWREIVKVWDAQGIASDRVGIDVTIGLPLIEAARTVVNRTADFRALLLEAEDYVREDQKELRQRIADALHPNRPAEPK